jgi:hypothetical protein
MYTTAILNVNAGSVNGNRLRMIVDTDNNRPTAPTADRRYPTGKGDSSTAMPWPIGYNRIDGSYHISPVLQIM